MYANWGHLTTLQDKSTQYNPIIYTTGTKKSKMNRCRRYTIKIGNWLLQRKQSLQVLYIS